MEKTADLTNVQQKPIGFSKSAEAKHIHGKLGGGKNVEEIAAQPTKITN